MAARCFLGELRYGWPADVEPIVYRGVIRLNWDARIARLFAVCVARHVLYLAEAEEEPEYAGRVRGAIEAGSLYARGEVTAEEMEAARSLARRFIGGGDVSVAATDAAWAAAQAATHPDDPLFASSQAREHAAHAAGWAALRDGGGSRAYGVAAGAERDWQRDRFVDFLLGIEVDCDGT